MPIVFAAVMPHGGALIPGVEDSDANASKKLTSAMRQLGKSARSAAVESLIVADPHGIRLDDAHSISLTSSTIGRLGPHVLEAEVDTPLAARIYESAFSLELPVAGIVSAEDDDPLPMEWGTFVPVWFVAGGMNPPPLVVICPSRAFGLEAMAELGEVIARVAESESRRIGIIASADNAHAHLEDGPYGFHQSAKVFDELIVSITEAGEFERWVSIDDRLIEEALPDSPWQLALLAGVFRQVPFRVEKVVYDCPSYFGMMSAEFSRQVPDD